MTLKETCKQIHDLSLGGFINREKFSFTEFYNAAKHWMNGTDSYVFEIALPDGWWYARLIKYGYTNDSYDYYIPDTREESDKIFNDLIAKYNS